MFRFVSMYVGDGAHDIPSAVKRQSFTRGVEGAAPYKEK